MFTIKHLQIQINVRLFYYLVANFLKENTLSVSICLSFLFHPLRRSFHLPFNFIRFAPNNVLSSQKITVSKFLLKIDFQSIEKESAQHKNVNSFVFVVKMIEMVCFFSMLMLTCAIEIGRRFN